jgi:hypothetical protein
LECGEIQGRTEVFGGAIAIAIRRGIGRVPAFGSSRREELIEDDSPFVKSSSARIFGQSVCDPPGLRSWFHAAFLWHESY